MLDLSHLRDTIRWTIHKVCSVAEPYNLIIFRDGILQVTRHKAFTFTHISPDEACEIFITPDGNIDGIIFRDACPAEWRDRIVSLIGEFPITGKS